MTAHLQALALVWAVVAPKSLLTVGGQPSWGPEEVGREDLLLHHQPHNTSLDLPPAPRLQVDPAPPQEPPSVGSEALDPNPCPISAQRLASASLLVRWERSVGFQCDVLLFTTSSHGRSSFSTALSGVSSPAVVDHVGAGGGSPGQQLFKLCVGCGGARLGRGPRRRSPSLRAERVDFCCLDFRLEELRGDPGWRLNRKPIESTLVACFMTIVIIIWSVAALIWPVPIIAGFLPNGMEQRRG